MCDFISKNIELFNKLDEYINEVKYSNNALVNTLHEAQNLFGYIPYDVQSFISKKLDVEISEIEYLINFYHYFSTELEGTYKIKVCCGKACSNSDSRKIINKLEELLDIKVGETTHDQKFTLDSSRCIGLCRRPSIISINGKAYEDITVDDIEDIIKNCK